MKKHIVLIAVVGLLSINACATPFNNLEQAEKLCPVSTAAQFDLSEFYAADVPSKLHWANWDLSHFHNRWNRWNRQDGWVRPNCNPKPTTHVPESGTTLVGLLMGLVALVGVKKTGLIA